MEAWYHAWKKPTVPTRRISFYSDGRTKSNDFVVGFTMTRRFCKLRTASTTLKKSGGNCGISGSAQKLKYCVRCGKTFYTTGQTQPTAILISWTVVVHCGKVCQRAHWQQHKPVYRNTWVARLFISLTTVVSNKRFGGKETVPKARASGFGILDHSLASYLYPFMFLPRTLESPSRNTCFRNDLNNV